MALVGGQILILSLVDVINCNDDKVLLLEDTIDNISLVRIKDFVGSVLLYGIVV